MFQEKALIDGGVLRRKAAPLAFGLRIVNFILIGVGPPGERAGVASDVPARLEPKGGEANFEPDTQIWQVSQAKVLRPACSVRMIVPGQVPAPLSSPLPRP